MPRTARKKNNEKEAAAPPGFPEMGCRAGVRAPRWYRAAPSGLNGAAHRAGARRPAAAVDPGDLWRATGPAKRAARGAAPVGPRRPPACTRQPLAGVLHPAPERRDTGTRQPPPDTSVHLFDYVNRQKNYKADRRSAAKLSLNQSRGAPATVHTGIALVTGTEDRQWLYPAMTRGTDANLAYVFTTPACPPTLGPVPGPLPNSGTTTASGTNSKRSPPPSPHRLPAHRSRASRSPYWLMFSAATAPNCPPPKPCVAT